MWVVALPNLLITIHYQDQKPVKHYSLHNQQVKSPHLKAIKILDFNKIVSQFQHLRLFIIEQNHKTLLND